MSWFDMIGFSLDDTRKAEPSGRAHARPEERPETSGNPVPRIVEAQFCRGVTDDFRHVDGMLRMAASRVPVAGGSTAASRSIFLLAALDGGAVASVDSVTSADGRCCATFHEAFHFITFCRAMTRYARFGSGASSNAR
ncbi:hypothetical protein [Burkholderia vietnamiensis]|uniref:hypothetical protein n=1 Tax=Burkholderia vietnamiensis TaxID=60552 RepID=UPI0012D91B56|nr:hypothetical protein [Burkholderia vietnamiensis]MDN7927524.1 hypothetical protein [Burkholderia vietnamiensis]HDR9252451.1 hypothetical protein [Burkholderia vietnamiensis]